jgi:hypothetical protein
MGALIGEGEREGTMDTNKVILGCLVITAIATVIMAAPAGIELYRSYFLEGPLSYTSDGLSCDETQCKLEVRLRNEGYRVDET